LPHLPYPSLCAGSHLQPQTDAGVCNPLKPAVDHNPPTPLPQTNIFTSIIQYPGKGSNFEMGGKKKNKVAYNPARGFATTSVPSKTKTPAPVPESTREKEIDTLVVAGPSEQGSGKADGISHIPNEEEMEEHRLKALVDKLGHRAGRETQRIVTKVEVEKRTIKSICYPLKVNKLLEFDFARYSNQSKTTGGMKELGVGDQILALAKEEFARMYQGNEGECKRGEALLLNAWILQKTFVSMGFPKERVEEGLLALTDHGYTALDKEKELDGALGEMFDWLALNCEIEELPGFYDEISKGKKKNVGSGSSGTHSCQENLYLEY